ncbi:hypothetical protein ABZ916_31270 [Streptomyces sp. NPDC046853]|uniref:hypothetical protein n=1 Tax=Streptomyces sp. NPDC046853 TaxID=3154920 RepID=UPI0033FC5A4A
MEGCSLGVVVDLLAQDSATIPPDSGDFRQDLHELARAIADIVRGAFMARTEHVTRLVHRAVGQVELPPDTQAKEAIAALSAPIDDRLVHTSAEAACHAAHAGVFNPSQSQSQSQTQPLSPPSSPTPPP